MTRPNVSPWFCSVLFLGVISVTAQAQPAKLQVQAEDSVFAIVTHKAGLAKTLAHNHFITASKYTAEGEVDTNKIENAKFHFSMQSKDLNVDDPAQQLKWWPRVEALDILQDKFKTLDDGDRKTIYDSAIEEDQLDVKSYPQITAELTDLTPVKSKKGTVEFSYQANVSVTVHGKTISHKIPANVSVAGGVIKVEAVGNWRFLEFGIKPVSKLLGTIKNNDEFQVYVNIQGKAS